jgi:hypothetical protein
MKILFPLLIGCLLFHLKAADPKDFYGEWVSDIDRTLEFNGNINKIFPDSMIEQMRTDPIYLTFDARHFTTNTSIDTIRERYRVFEDPDESILKVGFVDPNGKIERGVFLKIDNDYLLLNPNADESIIIFFRKYINPFRNRGAVTSFEEKSRTYNKTLGAIRFTHAPARRWIIK